MRDGLLLVDKDAGFTSHDVVQKVRRLLQQKKIGHCGTLDPDATGLLLLTLGTATRLTRFLIRAPKEYEGTIHFGVTTDTYDASGQVTATAPEGAVAALALDAVAEAMRQFEGTIQQTIPAYSAKKINGVKFYEMARRGEEVPSEPKEVTVFEFSPIGQIEAGTLRFRLGCTSGTYARALAHDLGVALGTGAHLSALRRTQIGSFHVDSAIALGPLAEKAAAGETADRSWMPFDEIPLPFGEITTDSQQEERISHGQTVLVRELDGEEGDWVKLVNRRQQFIAIGTVVERIGSAGVGIVQPKVVFR